MQRRSIAVLAGALALFAGAAVEGAELIVRIDGIASAEGTVSCGVFVGEEGFPDDEQRALNRRMPADPARAVCRFEAVPAGTIAVAVSHDRNGNGRLDKNFLGMPREPWGVSNGARPALRAPRFGEAAIEMPADGTLEVTVVVRQ